LTIIKLFAAIKDGKWHNITDLSSQIKVQTDKLTEFSKFLSTQGIVTYEEKTARIKVKPEWQNLLPTETEPTLDKTHHPKNPSKHNLPR
jgi:hypothetical protein